MLLDPAGWTLAEAGDDVLARLSGELASHTAPETHAAVVEVFTGVHGSVDGVVGELGALRGLLSRELHGMGLAVAAAGTHPLALAGPTAVSGGDRYRDIEASMRSLARRAPTMALHVHVGVPEPEDAIRVLNALRRRGPVLLALAANSPYSEGGDGGFASARTVIFQAFPRTGLPRHFADYDDYVATVDDLVAAGAVPDPSFLWWDVRLQPRLGTVEVRVMDSQTSVREVAPLIALIQSVARLALDGAEPLEPEPSAEVLAENRFLAARDGMNARLVDPAARRMVPVRETLDALLRTCRPHAARLGCDRALQDAWALAASNGAERQRAWARDGRLDRLVARLADRFLAPPWHAVPAGERAYT